MRRLQGSGFVIFFDVRQVWKVLLKEPLETWRESTFQKRALDGVESAFLVSPMEPGLNLLEKNFIDLCRESGVKHLGKAELVTDTVSKLLGRKALSFKDFARTNLDKFR